MAQDNTSFDNWNSQTIGYQNALRDEFHGIITAFITNTGEGQRLTQFVDEAAGITRPEHALTGEQYGQLDLAITNARSVIDEIA
jgi:hypothetical protein